MQRRWPMGLPFQAACPDCKVMMPRGTGYHACGQQTAEGIGHGTVQAETLVKFWNENVAKEEKKNV